MSRALKRLNEERSAKPPLLYQSTPEGYLLDETAIPRVESSSGVVGCIVAGALFLVFGWFILAIGVIVFTFALFNRALRQQVRAYFACFPGELIFSRYPLRPGDRDRVTFRRRLKGNRKVPKNSHIQVKLFCLECVSYTQGSDTIRETAVVEEKLLRLQSITADANQIACRFDVAIPKDLPASFEAKMNQIRWVITVEQTIPGVVKNCRSHFTLLVEP